MVARRLAGLGCAEAADLGRLGHRAPATSGRPHPAAEVGPDDGGAVLGRVDAAGSIGNPGERLPLEQLHGVGLGHHWTG